MLPSSERTAQEAGEPAGPGVEAVVRDGLTQVLDCDIEPDDLDLDLDMSEGYGLTSLKKVIFLMSVCDETRVSLSAFTEPDVAAMRTLRDVVVAVSGSAGPVT